MGCIIGFRRRIRAYLFNLAFLQARAKKKKKKNFPRLSFFCLPALDVCISEPTKLAWMKTS